MRNKFFFGVVVGFFVAVVAFVVFLFFSGTVKAAVLPDSPVADVITVGAVGVHNVVPDAVNTVEYMQTVSPLVAVGNIGLVDVRDQVLTNVNYGKNVPCQVVLDDGVYTVRVGEEVM